MSDTTKGYQLNQLGLVQDVEYKFKPNGRVDWRAMINPKYLVLNRQKQKEIEEKYQKSIDQISPTEVDDSFLLILLNGIKELATLRGYICVNSKLVKADRDHCAAECSITWTPNFETFNQPITFSDAAGASVDNTNGFGTFFLETIAINRAFVRAVRNFLGVEITGQDEIGGKFKKEAASNSQTVAFSSNAILEERCTNKGITFEAFRKRVIDNHQDKLSKGANPQAWGSFNDLKPIDASTLAELVKG